MPLLQTVSQQACCDAYNTTVIYVKLSVWPHLAEKKLLKVHILFLQHPHLVLVGQTDGSAPVVLHAVTHILLKNKLKDNICLLTFNQEEMETCLSSTMCYQSPQNQIYFSLLLQFYSYLLVLAFIFVL